MRKGILLVLLATLLNGCAVAADGLFLSAVGRKADEKLRYFALENNLSFQCVKKRNRILPLGIMLEYNRNIMIEKCKINLNNAGENDYEK